MTKTEAVFELIWQERANKLSLSGYRKTLRSCKILEVETNEVLRVIGFSKSDGELHDWLKEKLEAEKTKQEAKQ